MLGRECECRDVGPTKSGIIAGNFDSVSFVYKKTLGVYGVAMTHSVAAKKG